MQYVLKQSKCTFFIYLFALCAIKTVTTSNLFNQDQLKKLVQIPKNNEIVNVDVTQPPGYNKQIDNIYNKSNQPQDQSLDNPLLQDDYAWACSQIYFRAQSITLEQKTKILDGLRNNDADFLIEIMMNMNMYYSASNPWPSEKSPAVNRFLKRINTVLQNNYTEKFLTSIYYLPENYYKQIEAFGPLIEDYTLLGYFFTEFLKYSPPSNGSKGLGAMACFEDFDPYNWTRIYDYYANVQLNKQFRIGKKILTKEITKDKRTSVEKKLSELSKAEYSEIILNEIWDNLNDVSIWEEKFSKKLKNLVTFAQQITSFDSVAAENLTLLQSDLQIYKKNNPDSVNTHVARFNYWLACFFPNEQKKPTARLNTTDFLNFLEEFVANKNKDSRKQLCQKSAILEDFFNTRSFFNNNASPLLNYQKIERGQALLAKMKTATFTNKIQKEIDRLEQAATCDTDFLNSLHELTINTKTHKDDAINNLAFQLATFKIEQTTFFQKKLLDYYQKTDQETRQQIDRYSDFSSKWHILITALNGNFEQEKLDAIADIAPFATKLATTYYIDTMQEKSDDEKQVAYKYVQNAMSRERVALIATHITQQTYLHVAHLHATYTDVSKYISELSKFLTQYKNGQKLDTLITLINTYSTFAKKIESLSNTSEKQHFNDELMRLIEKIQKIPLTFLDLDSLSENQFAITSNIKKYASLMSLHPELLHSTLQSLQGQIEYVKQCSNQQEFIDTSENNLSEKIHDLRSSVIELENINKNKNELIQALSKQLDKLPNTLSRPWWSRVYIFFFGTSRHIIRGTTINSKTTSNISLGHTDTHNGFFGWIKRLLRFA